MTLRRLLPIVLSAFALAAAGCGDDNGGGGSPDGSAIDGDPATPLTGAAAQTAPADTTESTGKPFDPEIYQRVSKDLKKKPSIPKATGDAPDELQAIDVVDGKGRAAKDGDKVSVQYVGVTYDENKEFDTSWGRDEPFEFTLGEGAVIQGWDDGVKGMKVGGRRVLVIPAEQAYGAQGSPPNIGPNATLVFVVDLERVA